MIQFLADENFDQRIVMSARRFTPLLDVISIRDVQPQGVSDQRVLELGAELQRVVLSHDRKTMHRFAMERLRDGLPLHGLILFRSRLPVSLAGEELAILATASEEDEWVGRILYIPMG